MRSSGLYGKTLWPLPGDTAVFGNVSGETPRHFNGPSGPPVRKWAVRPVFRLVLSMIAAFTTALASARPALGAFDFKDATWEGSSELLAIARDRIGKGRVRLTAVIPWDEIQPRDALLVLHPNRELDYREVAAFLAAGGRLGVLDDYGKADALLQRFRIHRVRAPLKPDRPLRENPNLPVAVPATSGSDARPHTIVAGVDRIITNHPTGLETDRGLRLTTVLEMPAKDEPATPLALIGVIGDAKHCGLSPDTSEEPLTTTAAAGRCGRLFAMGDPSSLMNMMLRYPGNRTFAARLVEYLVGDDSWGKRGGSLYLVANDFNQRGSFGGKGGFLGALDDRLDALTRLVASIRREGLPEPLSLVLAMMAAGGAALWTVGAATRRYRRSPPRYARPTPLVAQGGLAGRAAVLAAESTHRALAVLELKAAMEEALRQRLGLPETAGTERILEEINRQDALSRRNSSELGSLLKEMARAEDAVGRTERIKVTPSMVRSMHDQMTSILAEVEQRLGTRQ
jgi:hypothetical protein